MLAGARFIAILLMLAAGMPALAQMYKWVDENGTVHYGGRCPPGIECSVLGSAPTPSQAEVEAARQRSDAMAERQASRSRQQQEAFPSSETHEGINERVQVMDCEKAWGEAKILKAALPVYRDADGLLHHWQSLNDHHYQGKRDYLDDQAREQSLAAANSILKSRCPDFRPSHYVWVYRFVGPPNLDELLELLEQHPSPLGPPENELCPYAHKTLEDFEAMQTGIPSDKERQLKFLVEHKCR